jgi:hypothetical protein
MDYYESVVVQYLRADRALFVNTQCCIQLNEAANPDSSGPHWYCDAVACDIRHNVVFLCEVSYSSRVPSLTTRLKEWHEHWALLCGALVRDSHVLKEWPVRPWLFIREVDVPFLLKRLGQIGGIDQPSKFVPRITTLEMVQPWQYCSWNRVGEAPKPEIIPETMRS